MAKFTTSVTVLVLVVLCRDSHSQQGFNPTILQDSRDLPKTDGSFGFLYRTEDGIAHAAKGDSNGIVHGRFTYTDPTGLKVNYNYNAGSRTVPGYNYNAASVAAQPGSDNNVPPQNNYREEQYDDGQYRPQDSRSLFSDAGAGDIYQQKRTRPPFKQNSLNTNSYQDYNYRN